MCKGSRLGAPLRGIILRQYRSGFVAFSRNGKPIQCVEVLDGGKVVSCVLTRRKKTSSQVAINRAILIGVLALSALLYACAKSPSANVRGDARAFRRPVHFYTVAEETAKRRVQAVGSLFRAGGKHPQFASGGSGLASARRRRR